MNLNFQEKPRRNRIESDSEYDSEMDDFIDDTEDKIDISKEIRSIFGYVPTQKQHFTQSVQYNIGFFQAFTRKYTKNYVFFAYALLC